MKTLLICLSLLLAGVMGAAVPSFERQLFTTNANPANAVNANQFGIGAGKLSIRSGAVVSNINFYSAATVKPGTTVFFENLPVESILQIDDTGLLVPLTIGSGLTFTGSELSATGAGGGNVSFGNFNPNQFASNATVISIKSGAPLTNVNLYGGGTGSGEFQFGNTTLDSSAGLYLQGGAQLDMDPTFNTTAIIVDGQINGSSGVEMMHLGAEWNTSGLANIFDINVTDTASDPLSTLANWRVSGVSKFSVTKSGNTFMGGITNNGALNNAMEIIAWAPIYLGDSNRLHYLTFSNGFITIFASNGVAFTINTTNRNVGISTANPVVALQVAGLASIGSSPLAGLANVTLNVDGSPHTRAILLTTPTTGRNATDGTFIGLNGADFYLQNQEAAGKTIFGSGGLETLTMDASQRVGIGTTTPSTSLDVTGGVRAASLIITNAVTFSGIASNTTPVNTLGQLSDGSVVKIARANGFPLTADGDGNFFAITNLKQLLLDFRVASGGVEQSNTWIQATKTNGQGGNIVLESFADPARNLSLLARVFTVVDSTNQIQQTWSLATAAGGQNTEEKMTDANYLFRVLDDGDLTYQLKLSRTNSSLSFMTNQLVVTNGSVGVGTAMPTAKLDVTAPTATPTIATHQTNAPVSFATTGYTNTTGGNVFVSIIGTSLSVTKKETNGTTLFAYGSITGTLPAIPLKPFQWVETSGTLTSNNVEPW